MNGLFCFILSSFCLILHWPESSSAKPITDKDADSYLRKFGYFVDIPNTSRDVGADSKAEALKAFQKMAGIPTTGKLDDATKSKMQQPRCGVADARKETREGDVAKWDKNTLTWALMRPTSQLPEGIQRTVIHQALDTWKQVVPLEFNEVVPEGQPDLQLSFARSTHDDPWPFDGPGGTLAHAIFPQDGRVHFDEDETWVVNDVKRLQEDQSTFDILQTSVHELGHALGLDHLPQQGAMMYPYYIRPEEGQSYEVKLSTYDIQAMQNIYGKRSGGPVAVTTPSAGLTFSRPKRVRTTTTQPSPDDQTLRPVHQPNGDCPVFTAAVTGTDGAMYFFNGDEVWQLKSVGGSTQTYRTKHFFPDSPARVDAALTSTLSDMTYLISGRRVWGYRWKSSAGEYELDKEFPRDLPSDSPLTPLSAFQWSDGNLILHDGVSFFSWEDYYNEVTFKGKMSDYFPHMPAEPSFSIGDKLYVLGDNEYINYDIDSKQLADKKSLHSLLSC